MVNCFEKHKGYSRMFKENHLTLGLFFPIESYEGSIPKMDIERQMKLAKRAKELNFAALFVRDVPLHDPYFGRSHTDQFKPFTQSLYVDLTEDPNHPPIPIHLGFRVGRNILIEFLESLKNIGVNHVIINLKYGHRPVEEVIEELGEEVVPHFPALTEE